MGFCIGFRKHFPEYQNQNRHCNGGNCRASTADPLGKDNRRQRRCSNVYNVVPDQNSSQGIFIVFGNMQGFQCPFISLVCHRFQANFVDTCKRCFRTGKQCRKHNTDDNDDNHSSSSVFLIKCMTLSYHIFWKLAS